MKKSKDEFENFDRTMGTLISVPHGGWPTLSCSFQLRGCSIQAFAWAVG